MINEDQKLKDYERIYNEGLVWKKRFESDFMFNDAPTEQPEFLPTIFCNSGKLSKVANTNKFSSALENAIKYL